MQLTAKDLDGHQLPTNILESSFPSSMSSRGMVFRRQKAAATMQVVAIDEQGVGRVVARKRPLEVLEVSSEVAHSIEHLAGSGSTAPVVQPLALALPTPVRPLPAEALPYRARPIGALSGQAHAAGGEHPARAVASSSKKSKRGSQS